MRRPPRSWPKSSTRTWPPGLAGHGLRVATGRFRQMMEVGLINDGPVTLLLDSKKIF